MKLVGLIAEYNPFHNGHQYHIEKALEITGADAAIVVMSGNFVQRGTPAIMPKHLRTEAALKAGASLVLELPVCYATGSAEFFAYGAISILDKLGCVDSICFGSECGNIKVLQDLAKIIHQEPKLYKDSLNEYLRQGNSFPLARQLAMKDYLKSNVADAILGEPNNILGIEYLKALYRLDSKMKPYTLKRVASGYHDETLSETYSSATAIRKSVAQCRFDEIHNHVPSDASIILQEQYKKRFPVYANDFSLLLKYKLLSETRDTLLQYMDVSEELANRICNQLNHFQNFDQFCELLKTKEITHSRISRALIHILLNIKNCDYTEIAYARMLGFRKEDVKILSFIKESGEIPLVSKLSGELNLSDQESKMLEQDIYASNLYETLVSDKFGTEYKNEYQMQIVRV